MGVLLPLPLSGAYDYLVPEGMEVAAGDFVEVPLGSRSVLGVVWGEAKDDVPRNKLKQIEAKIEMAPLPGHLAALHRLGREPIACPRRARCSRWR